mmetsp:Transcript_56369/g.150754  ORF Transcript_56369/g.150754 Transcript_56369/m.150754 type:complete len:220 (-) Transcript_56369:105-764(-)
MPGKQLAQRTGVRRQESHWLRFVEGGPELVFCPACLYVLMQALCQHFWWPKAIWPLRSELRPISVALEIQRFRETIHVGKGIRWLGLKLVDREHVASLLAGEGVRATHLGRRRWCGPDLPHHMRRSRELAWQSAVARRIMQAQVLSPTHGGLWVVQALLASTKSNTSWCLVADVAEHLVAFLGTQASRGRVADVAKNSSAFPCRRILMQELRVARANKR